MAALHGPAGFLLVLVVLSMVSPALAQDAAEPAGGTIYVVADPVTLTNSYPCETLVAYTMSEVAPPEAKAYTARSFAGTACTTRLNFEVPRAFTADEPVTIRAVMACDSPGGGAGVQGATSSVRFIVDHDGTAVTGNINLVGPTTCGTTPIVFQAQADLDGEEFDVGDILTVRVIPFYTTGGVGDPNKSMHFKTGGANPSILIIPDLAVPGGGGNGSGGLTPLYQNVTTPELRVGRNATENLTQVEVYNWTSTEDPVLSYEANVTAGEVRITVTDALNETRLNQTVDATGNGSSPVGAPGNLTLRLEYLNFTGSLVVQMAAAPVAETNTTTTAGPVTTNDDDRTGTFPLRHEEKTPGVGPVALLVLVAMAGILTRRRLR